MLWLLLACGPKDDIKPSSPTDFDGDGVFSIQSGGQDCDDQNADVFPGATEICNELDDDCDGQTDDDDTDLASIAAEAPAYHLPASNDQSQRLAHDG